MPPTSAPAVSAPSVPARAGVPWYIHPAEAPTAWRRLVDGAYEFAFAVVNVHDGPGGPDADPYYGPALARGAATPLVGYVTVDYGERAWADVLRDVQRWRERYGIDDVMLDCVPSRERQGRWSIEWIDALRREGVRRVIVNPGVSATRRLIETADVTCVAETSWQEYEHAEMPSWLMALDPTRQWHLVHSVPTERLADVARLSRERGAHFCWATERTMPNPWDRLPLPYLGCHTDDARVFAQA